MALNQSNIARYIEINVEHYLLFMFSLSKLSWAFIKLDLKIFVYLYSLFSI